MKRMSLAQAKTHISELVDAAEHHGRRIIILRHGKPAAAIVPVNVAVPPKPSSRKRSPNALRQTKKSVLAFVEEFSAAEPRRSAVDDLLRGRR